jgi:hercynylcysteine S-oxide lyase
VPLPNWSGYTARRPPSDVLHLDSAAAGRSSVATLAAATAHALREAQTGAHVAQDHAAPILDRLRADVGMLVGLPADSVAFTESASTARRALLDAWVLGPGSRIAVVASEWGPNLEAFADMLLDPVFVDVDGEGVLDLEALEQRLADDPPDAVHLTHVASHRGLVQPVAAAAALCRDAGVPLWVDAAQALGHVDSACGADAVYGTSRKWLAGPRGVGFLAVAEPAWAHLGAHHWAMTGEDRPEPAYLESHEAHVAGRLGLANAVTEFLADDPQAVFARLAEVGQQTRAALADVPGWEIAGDPTAPTAITALRPIDGQDVAATRARLLTEHRILTTAGAVVRAPREMRGPLLRVSPHVDCDAAALEALRRALTG